MQYNTKDELYEQIRQCDIIIYHIVDDAGEIDEAVWAVSREYTHNVLLLCYHFSDNWFITVK